MTDLPGTPRVASNDFVIASHPLFGNPATNSRLARTYNVLVNNAVALEEKNR